MTAPVVGTGATLACTFGSAPSTLAVLPKALVDGAAQPVANINDHIPLAEVMSFGMCRTLNNPAVASATSAHDGHLTPQPCVPVLPAPWTPGNPMVLVGGAPIVTQTSTCTCMWSGVISVTRPGQSTVVS